MILKRYTMYQTLFTAICFFLLGFNFVVGLITLFMYYLYNLKTYKYYFAYLFFTLISVLIVFSLEAKMFKDIKVNQFLSSAKDTTGVLLFFSRSYFCYKSELAHDPSHKKFEWVFYLYGSIVILHTFISIFLPSFVLEYPIYNVFYRGAIICISLSLFYISYTQLHVVYFRYLYAGSIILLIFSLLGIWNSTVKQSPLDLQGFLFIYFGIILENFCFVFALVTHIIVTNRRKRLQNINNRKQLILVEQEIQKHTTQYLGREIHDNIGQKIILAGLSVKHLSMENLSKTMAEKVQYVGGLLDETLVELRSISKSLVDQQIANKKIVSILTLRCKEIDKIKPCSFVYQEKVKNLNLNYKTKIVLVRIVQEFSQNNSIKHSGCNKITVDLSMENSALVLTLKDDGKGFDIQNPAKSFENGLGLKNIKKRAALIGSDLSLESAPEKGTCLILKIPLKNYE
ncbi:MAG: hypothetical protein C4K58_05535 [Flavobacteriaceae bacterium]|nr:MAG: hypothetical protein C4K58_05535 [Flavobacteriaceae bacterium]